MVVGSIPAEGAILSFMKIKLAIAAVLSLLTSGCVVVDRQIGPPGVYVEWNRYYHRPFREVTPVRIERKVMTGPNTYRFDSYIGYRDHHGNIYLWPGN